MINPTVGMVDHWVYHILSEKETVPSTSTHLIGGGDLDEFGLTLVLVGHL